MRLCFPTLELGLLGLLRGAPRRLCALGILRAFQFLRQCFLLGCRKRRELEMTVETDIQLLRNMKKGMRTIVIVGIRIQWLLESQRGRDV